MNNVVALIPAKANSNRLPHKNKYEFRGKPLINWTLDEAVKSKYIDTLYVSTDDEFIKQEAECRGATVVDRPKHLTLDHVGKRDVLIHALSEIQQGEPKYVCLLQANSPQIKVEDIDKAIEKVIQSNGKIKDCCSMNKHTLVTDGAIRVFEFDVLFAKGPGMYQSCILTDYVDVHTEEDLSRIEEILDHV